MKTLLLAAVVLVGCGGEAPFTVDVLCYRFHSALPLDGEVVKEAAELADKMMYERLDINFCGSIVVDVVVVESITVAGAPKSGLCIPAFGIYVLRDLDSLLHELLHAWDFHHAALGSAWHEGWKTNGYEVTANMFKRRAVWVDK